MDNRRLSARARRLPLKWMISFFILITLAGCISAPLPEPTSVATPKVTPATTSRPTQATPTPTLMASPTRLPTPIATPPLSSTPTPTASIVVYTPAPNDKISRSVHISGVARVSEGQIDFAIKDAQGKVLAQGTTLASAGVPEWGVFAADPVFEPPAKEQSGTVEVFNRSPRDGSVQDLVIIPVILLPK